MDLTVIFSAGKAAFCIGEYLGFLESIGSKLDKIAMVDFNTAIRTLKEAIDTNQVQRCELLKEAAQNFRRSISLEKDERLYQSFLGLAMCQYHLGDIKNAKKTLQELIEYNIPITKGDQALMIGSAINPIFAAGFALKSQNRANKQKTLEVYKVEARKIQNTF
jgi:hypothetical protein